jgi:hypothetical protein
MCRDVFSEQPSANLVDWNETKAEQLFAAVDRNLHVILSTFYGLDRSIFEQGVKQNILNRQDQLKP